MYVGKDFSATRKWGAGMKNLGVGINRARAVTLAGSPVAIGNVGSMPSAF